MLRPTSDMSLIYYASPAYVDQLYHAAVGHIGHRTIRSETQAGGSGTAEAGFARLLAAIGELRAKGSVELRRTTGETIEIQESVHDRAAVLLTALKDKLPPLDAQSEGVCWYSLPTQLISRKSADDVMIEVSYEASNLAFFGVTSVAHWCSASLRNNLLMAAARSADRSVPTFGILLPLHTTTNAGRTEIQAQFIIIASPDTW